MSSVQKAAIVVGLVLVSWAILIVAFSAAVDLLFR